MYLAWVRVASGMEGLSVLSGACLRLDAVDGFHELGAYVGSRVTQDDDSYAVAFAPKNVMTLRNIGFGRMKKNSLKHLVCDAGFCHLVLRVATHGDVAELWNILETMPH
jgi:hypothetical protein